MYQTHCPRCNASCLAPSNRLITENCGHIKCRECFISDTNGCHECQKAALEPIGNSATLLDISSAPSSDSILADVESESGDLCIDTEVDDSTPFDGPIQPIGGKGASSTTTTEVVIESVVNVLQNFTKAPQDQDETSETRESLKILEEYIIAPKEKIENFFRETKCAGVAERRKPLPEHVVKITENGKTSYRCNICGKGFHSRNQRYYHAYCGDSESKPHRCKTCQKTFSTSSHLNYHIKTHDTSKYPCNLCSKTFMRSISLKSHKRTHDGLFRFKCKECGLGFNERKSFTAHINKHRNILPFMCKVCGKKFSFKSNLTQHQRIHTGLGKRFRCDDCDKEFLRKNSYKEHLLRHSKVKNFQCKVCQSFFIDRKTLERHMNTHGSKVYKCPNCDVKCGRKDNLVRHIRNMHPKEDITNIFNNIKMVIVTKDNDSPQEVERTDEEQIESGTAEVVQSFPSTSTIEIKSIEIVPATVNQQQPVAAGMSVIRSIGNVKPVHIPNDCDLTNVYKTTPATESNVSISTHDPIDSNPTESIVVAATLPAEISIAPVSDSSNICDKTNEPAPAPALPKEVKKPKKKYDPCEIYRKILFANDDGDDSVLESEQLYSDSRDEHIGCCDMNNTNTVACDQRTDEGRLNTSRIDSIPAPSNFSEIHWRKRTSQSFYTSL